MAQGLVRTSFRINIRTRKRRLAQSATVCASFCGLFLLPNPTVAGNSKVLITGGPDTSGQQYSWTVTNENKSAIVYVEFPHYRAVLFFAPEGWATDCTYLVNVGSQDKPGVCDASVDNPRNGIARGRSAMFRMQLAAGRTRRGVGVAVVRFADGTQEDVSGVELPEREAISDKYVSLAGLGIMLAIAITIQRYRARRKLNPPG